MRLVKKASFFKDYLVFRAQGRRSSEPFPFGKFYPCLNEKTSQSGEATGHYFHQDLLVAQRIFVNEPERHVDIGSRIDGFVSHVASFRKIEVFDVRPLETRIPNVLFRRADLMNDTFDLKDYCDSVSSLHAIEHFGLGRYGDRLDFEGHIKGLNNIYKLLKWGGKFYFSVPMGEQRIEFNAHRVFSLPYILDLLKRKYRIDAFSYVNDQGDLIRDAGLRRQDVEGNFGCHYGCAIFELTKEGASPSGRPAG